MEYRREVYEIVGRVFDRCGACIGPGDTCPSTRRFAIRKLHIGQYCDAGANSHKHDWLPNLPWAKPADFAELGPFAGWVPPNAFPAPDRTPKKRRGGWELSPSRHAQFEVEINRPGAECLKCSITWFKGQRNSGEAAQWLSNAERRILWPEVIDAINKMIPKPSASEWYDRLPTDLRAEVKFRFDDSRLRAGHPLSIAFLRAAKVETGKRFTEAIQRFGVNALVIPLCEVCNGRKGARLFDSREDLLERWALYRFGSVVAANVHPEMPYFDFLADLAYNADLVSRVDEATRQRKRKG